MFSQPPKSEEEPDVVLAGTRPVEQWDLNSQRIRDTSRLGMLPSTRLTLASIASFGVGSALGISQGSTMAGLKFRAEHAHKLPTTPTGWYMYHKTKNYHMARGGVREGVKMGLKVCVVTSAMFFIEDLYDEYRQSKDFINTTLASLTVAGGFSLWNKFSLPMTARTTKTALVVGLVYGGMQDVAGAVRGRPIGYIDWVHRKLGGEAREGLEKAAP